MIISLYAWESGSEPHWQGASVRNFNKLTSNWNVRTLFMLLLPFLFLLCLTGWIRESIKFSMVRLDWITGTVLFSFYSCQGGMLAFILNYHTFNLTPSITNHYPLSANENIQRPRAGNVLVCIERNDEHEHKNCRFLTSQDLREKYFEYKGNILSFCEWNKLINFNFRNQDSSDKCCRKVRKVKFFGWVMNNI